MCDPVTALAITAGGKLAQGIAAKKAGDENAALIAEQAATEAQLSAVKDERLRQKMAAQIAKQRLQLTGRGMSLDSPQAIAMGRQAAGELSYASQSVRSQGSARQAELSAARRASISRGRMGLLTGVLGAAGSVVSAAPDIWPSLAGGSANG